MGAPATCAATSGGGTFMRWKALQLGGLTWGLHAGGLVWGRKG